MTDVIKQILFKISWQQFINTFIQFLDYIVHYFKQSVTSWLYPIWYSGADLHSTRLFCSGVPVSTTLLRVLMAFNALEILDVTLRRMCPSSQTTKSGPIKGSTVDRNSFRCFSEDISVTSRHYKVAVPGSTSMLLITFWHSSDLLLSSSVRFRYISYPINITPPSLCQLCRALSRSGRCFAVVSSVTCNHIQCIRV